MSLTAVTQRPGSGTAEPVTEEKLASRRREAGDREEEECVVVEEWRSHQRREEDEEEAGGRTNSTVAPGDGARNPASLLEKCGTIRQGNPQSQVLIACVHGDQLPYPVATVRLNWKGEDETIKVGVIPNLGEDLILVTDYVDFSSLLNKAGQEQVLKAWCEEIPFGVGEEENRKPRIKLSKKQKREEQQKYRLARDPRNTDSKDPPSRHLHHHRRFPTEST
ncbi:hypothetical protein NDU88_006245 [Pleurodeles waltl]|uniref:Uncharacterized protein n=1 Tax=Pleurodeles waltl TaxID=8319 RepID=A0AAV7TXX8_PLEWA|nr:hypothetical protein NDU88_006245 [Pleurodeles waltl]